MIADILTVQVYYYEELTMLKLKDSLTGEELSLLFALRVKTLFRGAKGIKGKRLRKQSLPYNMCHGFDEDHYIIDDFDWWDDP